MKEILEESFGKDFFTKKITERVNNYRDVCDILRVNPCDDSIKIEVEGFDRSELNVVRNFIKKLRITKVLNEGWLPKKGDRRWYNWYDVSSGFVFVSAYCVSSFAFTDSASRLCFKDSELAKFYTEKFKDVDEGFFDL